MSLKAEGTQVLSLYLNDLAQRLGILAAVDLCTKDIPAAINNLRRRQSAQPLKLEINVDDTLAGFQLRHHYGNRHMIKELLELLAFKRVG